MPPAAVRGARRRARQARPRTCRHGIGDPPGRRGRVHRPGHSAGVRRGRSSRRPDSSHHARCRPPRGPRTPRPRSIGRTRRNAPRAGSSRRPGGPPWRASRAARCLNGMLRDGAYRDYRVVRPTTQAFPGAATVASNAKPPKRPRARHRPTPPADRGRIPGRSGHPATPPPPRFAADVVRLRLPAAAS